MKVKELIGLLRSAANQDVYITFVEYNIHDYLNEDETEIICSFRSDFKYEYFLNNTILNGEVVSIGIKSDNELVLELSEDWNAPKVDVRIPSKVVSIDIKKNDFGLSNVTIKDLEEDDLIKLLARICVYFDASTIVDQNGKRYTLDDDDDNDGERRTEEGDEGCDDKDGQRNNDEES